MGMTTVSIESLPDFKINEIPTVKLKSIHFHNYKAFEDFFLDFSGDNSEKLFACFYGPNGCGKTTILNTIQMIFSRYEGYDEQRLKALLSKSIRHIGNSEKSIPSDFLVTAKISSSLGDYEIQITKNGFIKDHPPEIKQIVYRLCFYTRFDQELHQFQLQRSQWLTFKDLFESVTGFEVEEIETLFDQSDDPRQAEMLRKYVLGFNVLKPDETISHRECSSGERKIIKSFSTLLNKEYMPQIILVDNVAMHVEAGRHIDLINSMKRCFPNSQIFATTHSYHISKNFGERNQLYDLRMIKASNLIRSERWRMYLADEIQDLIFKLQSMSLYHDIVDSLLGEGRYLINKLMAFNGTEEQTDILLTDVKRFITDVGILFVNDMFKYYSSGEQNASL